jgi:hypothetical protein
MSGLNINSARCEALFASSLQRSECPDGHRVHQAITLAVRQFGSSGCALRMAQEFGDHPDSAAARMRWIREVVAETYESRALRRTIVVSGHNHGSRKPAPVSALAA